MTKNKKSVKKSFSSIALILFVFVLLNFSASAKTTGNGAYLADEGLIANRQTFNTIGTQKYCYEYEVKSIEVLDTKSEVFLRFADSRAWTDLDSITTANSVTVSMGMTIGAKGDVWSGQVTASINTQESITETIRRTGIPGNAPWRLGLIGKVLLVRVTYKVTSYALSADGTTVIEKKKLNDTVIKQLVHRPQDTSILKIFKGGSDSSSAGNAFIKYVGLNGERYLNVIQNQNIGTTISTTIFTTVAPTTSYITF